ncbi:MAG TPA: alpha/beta fold hydrolase [Candidatus Acidoferrales bacterium]|nr:alpha/beta fold hydrolase [Candidatus Acidoferrales bacterium]
MKEFRPHLLLRNAHAMTIAANFWPRPVPLLPRGVARSFETEPGTQVLGVCHWQQNPREHPTLVVLHGLEGSCESGYMLGTSEKAWIAGFNVVRLNQRNCGGTEKLSPTLYHSGLSCDVRAVVLELAEHDGLPEIFAAGYSMGGNLVLKMAGEMGAAPPAELRGVVAIAPALDLAACADALSKPRNFIYEHHFVTRLKRRMRHKASLFTDLYPLHAVPGFRRVRTVREFDDVITARYCGFADSSDYYARSSASQVVSEICVPTLIIAAKDDPFVPFGPFQNPAIAGNRWITLMAPEHGGHCAFISQEDGPERFWAEARIVEFCASQSRFASAPGTQPANQAARF